MSNADETVWIRTVYYKVDPYGGYYDTYLKNHWFEGYSEADALARAERYFCQPCSPTSSKAKGWSYDSDGDSIYDEFPEWADFDDITHDISDLERDQNGRTSNPGLPFAPFDINNYVMAKKAAAGGGAMAVIPRIVCKNGLSLYVQAGSHNYCMPRSDRGPWRTFEVGYPSRYIPDLMPYVENDSIPPTDSVYSNVPGSLINKIVQRSGGLKIP
jgi:hypothetical protein